MEERIKIIYGSEALDDQERQLTLEMPISEMTHAERERKHTYKITSRQSLSN
jgi:hypothetical protein